MPVSNILENMFIRRKQAKYLLAINVNKTTIK